MRQDHAVKLTSLCRVNAVQFAPDGVQTGASGGSTSSAATKLAHEIASARGFGVPLLAAEVSQSRENPK